jgi:hypothetical protein
MHAESRHVHLTDDELMENYFLAVDNPHLTSCGDCRARYDELARSLDLAAEDAALEADAIFTNERLNVQRERVLRRLERQGHAAEVLRFPNRFGAPRVAHRLLGPARRWVAGAAVAGLVAGVLLGFAVDRGVAGASVARRAAVAATTASSWQPGAAQDEQMLTEIEDALTGPARPVTELRALDAMTIPAELQEASFVPR